MSKRKVELGDGVQDIISGVYGIAVKKTHRLFSERTFTVVEDRRYADKQNLIEHVFEEKRLYVTQPNALKHRYVNPNKFDYGTI